MLNESHEEVELTEDEDEETRFTDNIKIDGLEDTPISYTEGEETYGEDSDIFNDEFNEFGQEDDSESESMDELLDEDFEFEDDGLELEFDDSDDEDPLE